MKKIAMIIMLIIINIISLGAVESKLVKDEFGRYSGSATLQLVARGRILEKPKNDILIIKSEDDSSEVSLKYNNVKEGKTKIAKQKFSVEVLEQDMNGNLITSNHNTISSKLINENGNSTNVAVQNYQGEKVGMLSYGLTEKNNS